MNKCFSLYNNYKSLLLIVNPVSGRRMIVKYIPEILTIFSQAGYASTVMVTEKRGDATEFAALYAKDFDLIVCTGGDGTLNETLTGLAKSNVDIQLGYIPCGSTNDFAATHNLSADILQAARNIVKGKSQRYDVGCFDDQYFSYVAAFGAFSWLSYTTDQNLKNILGRTAYMLDAIKDVNKIKPIHLTVKTDDNIIEDDFIFGAVCNSTSIAGVFQLPHSVVDTSDGEFEVLLIRMPKTIIDLDEIVNGLLLQDYSSKFIILFKADKIIVENAPGLRWSLDGEKSKYLDTVEIKVIPGFLNLCG